MSSKSDVSMPCKRTYFCGNNACRHARLCATLREGLQYRRGPYAHGQAPPQKEKPPLAYPANTVYLYDGSLDGFYCCVHESVYCKEIPCEIWPENAAEPTLFHTKLIETDRAKAKKVQDSVAEKISPRVQELCEATLLCCLAHREIAMLRFLLLGYRVGAQVAYLFNHSDVKPILDATRHMGSEAHLLKGFVRFSDYGGVLAATISPKNFVLPYLQQHFVMRYSQERFIIYDKTHKAALIYESRQARIIPLEAICFPEADEREEKYRALWKQFYNTIAIEARENPRCRMSLMPKRYWENMLEVSDLLGPNPVAYSE